jgi:membrane protein
MGVIPLSVLWIYISWLIVLFGLQLTYATQYLRNLDEEEMAELRKREDCFMVNDFTAMKILGFIMDAFEERRAPVRSELVCNKLNIPPEFGNRILDHLVKEGMLCRTSEPRNGFIPATDGENITLADISDVVAKASYAQDEQGTPKELKSIMDKQYEILKQHTLLQVIGRRKTR